MQVEIGKIYKGIVKGIKPYGAFVELDKSTVGMVHISEVASSYVNNINEHLTENQEVSVMVVGINEVGKISLSIKKAEKTAPSTGNSSPNRSSSLHRSSPPRSSPPHHHSPSSQNARQAKAEPTGPPTFEEMFSKYKQRSEEKMGEIRRNIEGKRGSSRKK